MHVSLKYSAALFAEINIMRESRTFIYSVMLHETYCYSDEFIEILHSHGTVLKLRVHSHGSVFPSCFPHEVFLWVPRKLCTVCPNPFGNPIWVRSVSLNQQSNPSCTCRWVVRGTILGERGQTKPVKSHLKSPISTMFNEISSFYIEFQRWNLFGLKWIVLWGHCQWSRSSCACRDGAFVYICQKGFGFSSEISLLADILCAQKETIISKPTQRCGVG